MKFIEKKLQSMGNIIDFNFSPSMSRDQDDSVMMRAGKGITALRLSVDHPLNLSTLCIYKS